MNSQSVHILSRSESINRRVSSSSSYGLLCHTITHADINVVLLLDQDNKIMSKPSFSKYKTLCLRLLDIDFESVTPITYLSNNWKTEIVVGFRLWEPLELGTLQDWRIRSKDVKKHYDLDLEAKAMVFEVYFPILCIVIPYWLRFSSSKTNPAEPKHMLILISGSGAPNNIHHPVTGNSSRNLATLIQNSFIHVFYPDIEVSILHSGKGLFSYHANINFMRSRVRETVAYRRSELARGYKNDWKSRFHVMASISNGPVARTQALGLCLREFQPDYIHVSHTKSFWHRYPDIDELWEDDAEVLEFHIAELTPAIHISETEDKVSELVKQVVYHRDNFFKSVKLSELGQFWLRKSKKPVLSVLMTRKTGEAQKYYYGMNMEVSMPTGSLCAERNAIGTAIADDPSLQRSDIKMIAVLSLTISPEEGSLNPILPCGACNEWLRKISAVNPDFRVITFKDESCDDIFIHYVT